MAVFSKTQRRALREAALCVEWDRTPTGYEMMYKGSLAVLSKKGKRWVLSHGGREHDLGRKATFDTAERALQRLGEARLDLDQIKADIMSDDPLTYDAFYPDDLHGSLKDRIEEIVYYDAYTAAAGKHDEEKVRRKLAPLFLIAKKEKILPAIEKAWRDGLKDGGA